MRTQRLSLEQRYAFHGRLLVSDYGDDNEGKESDLKTAAAE